MTLLSVNNLSVSFRGSGGVVEAAKNISLTLKKGEILGLVGESGSGKSVTALSILQLLPYPNAFHPSGSITLDGKELLGAPEPVLREARGGRIGMIFQEPMTSLNPLHTIGKQLTEMIEIHGNRTEELKNRGIEEKEKFLSSSVPPIPNSKQRVLALLDAVGLPHFKDRLDAYPHQLSGGERQRVMIAIAIANNPSLLIADEPTTALDVTIQKQILALLKKLRDERGMAILLITHDLPLVRRMADTVAVMQAGNIVETGKTKELFSNPKHPYTQRLLASEPKGAPVPVPANAPVVVECDGLSVEFPTKKDFFGKVLAVKRAVDSATLSVREGMTLGIVGESGSGKTTLALALLRLIKSKGRIVFLGRAIDPLGTAAIRPLRKKMQVVFQDPYASLSPRLTIAEIIAEGMDVHEPQLATAERGARVDAILKEVGLTPEMKTRYPHEFSGGQRQRIAIARAMILKPALVVLDEPTSALDLSIQAQIIALLKDLQAKHQLSFVFISHDLRVVKALAHEIAVMKDGKIVERGPADKIFTSPQESYTKALIDAAFAA
jgi:microcin C transport system ATP-binding protein